MSADIESAAKAAVLHVCFNEWCQVANGPEADCHPSELLALVPDVSAGAITSHHISGERYLPSSCCRWNDMGAPQKVDISSLEGTTPKAPYATDPADEEGAASPDTEEPAFMEDEDSDSMTSTMEDSQADRGISEAAAFEYQQQEEHDHEPGLSPRAKTEAPQPSQVAQAKTAPLWARPAMQVALAVVSAVLWVWRLLPFWLRRALAWQAPPPPSVHASPALAAFMQEPDYARAMEQLVARTGFDRNTGMRAAAQWAGALGTGICAACSWCSTQVSTASQIDAGHWAGSWDTASGRLVCLRPEQVHS